MTNREEVLKNFLKVPARWENDCQRKQDYDGDLIRLSTRYYPWTYQKNWYCSAHSAIVFNHGEPDEYGTWDYNVLVEKTFEAPTEEEVKKMVEEWAQLHFAWIQSNLVCFFKFFPNESEIL